MVMMTEPFNVDVTIIYPQSVLFQSHNFEGEEIQPLHFTPCMTPVQAQVPIRLIKILNLLLPSILFFVSDEGFLTYHNKQYLRLTLLQYVYITP